MKTYFVLYCDPDEKAPDNIYLSRYAYYDENDFLENSGLEEVTILKLIENEGETNE